MSELPSPEPVLSDARVPNTDQQAAIEHEGSPLLVIAGAGTGKTEMLTNRVIRTIERGILPQRIMMMTFTNKAAQNMMKRIQAKMGREVPVVTGTFHGLAYKLLNTVGFGGGFYEGQRILGEYQVQRIWEKSYQTVFNEQQRGQIKRMGLGGIPKVKSWMGKIRTGGLTLNTLRDAYPEVQNWEGFKPGCLRDLFKTYTKLKLDYRGLDFDDILVMFRDMLKKDELRDRVQSMFDAFFVDEYQDTSAIQAEILQLLVGSNPNVTVVGDPNQCQPAGTMVAMADGSTKAIEQIVEGDKLVTYNRPTKVFQKNGTVTGTSSSQFEGMMYTVTADGKSTQCTGNHKWVISWLSGQERNVGQWCTYLMRKGNYFRVGKSKFFRTSGPVCSKVLGVALRLNQEKANAVWVLKVHDTEAEATCCEQITAATFGLPEACFQVANRCRHFTQDILDTIFRSIPDQEARAVKCLTAHGRDIAYPLFDKSQPKTRRTVQVVHTCNLIPGMMKVPVMPAWLHHKDRTGKWAGVEVSKQPFAGRVYSLRVLPRETYVANGLATHNSIYSFLSANVDNILESPKLFPGTRIIKLSVNYRSTQAVLDFANRIMEGNRETIFNPLHSSKTAGAKPVVHKYGSDKCEADGVLRDIKALIDGGTPPHHIAILSRQSFTTFTLESKLTAQGISYVKYGGLKLTAKKNIRQFLAFLELALDRFNWLAWEAILPMIPMIGEELTVRLVGDLSYNTSWDWKNPPPLSLGSGKRWHAFSKAWQQISRLDELKTSSVETFLRDAFGLFVPLYNDYIVNASDRELQSLSSEDDVDSLYLATTETELSGYNKEGKEANSRPEASEKLKEIEDYIVSLELTRREDLQTFLNQFQLDDSKEVSFNPEGKLIISTIHSAKGLEWPVVFLLGLEEGTLPPAKREYGTVKDAELRAAYPSIQAHIQHPYLEEEQRLFYVAVTRAMHTLHLCMSSQRMGRGMPDSRFIKPFRSETSATQELRLNHFVREKMRSEEDKEKYRARRTTPRENPPAADLELAAPSECGLPEYSPATGTVDRGQTSFL